jgi:hypothetical protein
MTINAAVSRDALQRALFEHEWVWLQGDTGPRCLHCRNLREWGHKPACLMRAVVATDPLRAESAP